ncbi:Bug family tripartite tricarboxylate transporter substrate binding protein [Neoroseomonas oryzicola]|uniref:Tripartite tricarboxylate transporter substrate binding protein n=1 Tax=Neoroseomonas oryzicola TaxID=535904 RepID=A0A9X9WLA6_9PROT|nr:tripartite tricarboxylate transporter substrate-binding protein [Neoroseomonas oryzicola]MBR0661116.1 tripartite tricarboxylate transporter substrate binding protein [Neoroseomonas oryzicola]NKE17444.1 tripartite tricarboxylate transporter substrate binding protein [Neoroseomonas oryzicola]
MNITRRPLLLAGLFAPAIARAQAAWRPDRPVRIVVPFAPGGATDVVARVLSETLAAQLGQPVVIENRAGGAAGLIGSDSVAKAAPDGHTLLLHSNAHVIAPSLVARMPYDPIADFAAVAYNGRVPQVLVVNNRLPVTDMASLITWLRANSGKINFASAGIGSGNHLASEVFRAALPGIEMQMVQYRGGGPAMAAVISGDAHMAIDPIASAVSHIRAGTVRAIAVAGPTRAAILPDTPSATEAGLPAWSIAAWFATFAPARTPPAAIATLNAAFNATSERLATRLGELGVEPQPQYATPEAVMAFVREDMVRSAAILRAAGVQPE